MIGGGKESRDYLSENAKKVLSNPERAREFLAAWMAAGNTASLSWEGEDVELQTLEDIANLVDGAAVWIAQTQAGFETWMQQEGMVPVEEGDL